MSDAEEKKILITFDSPFPKQKQEKIDSKIKEMAAKGWKFIEAKPVKIKKSNKHVGGASEMFFKK